MSRMAAWAGGKGGVHYFGEDRGRYMPVARGGLRHQAQRLPRLAGLTVCCEAPRVFELVLAEVAHGAHRAHHHEGGGEKQQDGGLPVPRLGVGQGEAGERVEEGEQEALQRRGRTARRGRWLPGRLQGEAGTRALCCSTHQEVGPQHQDVIRD